MLLITPAWASDSWFEEVLAPPFEMRIRVTDNARFVLFALAVGQ
jgi:hypothetical protein